MERVLAAKVGLLVLALFGASCTSKGILNKTSIGGTSTLEKHKLKNGNTVIAGEFFSLESKLMRIPAFMNINGVIHFTDSGKFSFNVLPGTYKIEGGFVSKKWVVVKNIQVDRGDSIFLKLYLADDDRPLYEQHSKSNGIRPRGFRLQILSKH